MSTAIQVCAEAYRNANLDQDLTSFSTSQEFPYNLSIDLINKVIREMNRMGSWWFTETETALAYTVGVYSYSFTSLSVDPKKVLRIRREVSGQQGELRQYNWRQFQITFRQSSILTTLPTGWSKYGNTLELNVIPDQDYTLGLYHYRDMPVIAATTDTFLVPVADEDVLTDGVYAYLLQRMGRPDFQAAYQLFKEKAVALMGDNRQDAGLPSQMPANF